MKKKSIGAAYLEMWKRCFDYRGTSGLREYWIPVIIHALLLVLAVVWQLLANSNGWTALPFWILIVFLTLSIIPFVSLTVRRLHDTGKKGAWAWLLLLVGPGTLAVLIICASTGGFTPGWNRPVNLYGPPPIFEPSQNMNEDVYGPPEWFGTTEGEEDTTEGPTDPFEPSQNEPVAVYGPPEWFRPSSNENVDVYGPPEWFDPSEEAEGSERDTEEETEETTEEETEEETPADTLDPNQNINEPLYGVPTPTAAR